MGNDAHMMQYVQQYPCPWCLERSGFGSGPARVYDWFASAARGTVMWINPKKAVTVLMSPGMLAHCRNCRQPVGICGHCDHPNRAAGMDPVCDNCGKTYRPG